MEVCCHTKFEKHSKSGESESRNRGKPEAKRQGVRNITDQPHQEREEEEFMTNLNIDLENATSWFIQNGMKPRPDKYPAMVLGKIED